MKFVLDTAQLFVPDGLPAEEALARTTHMAVSAHHDDIEIMAADGILSCFQQPDQWFLGVVVSNGGGSPRDGLYAHYTDEDMRVVRSKEQKKAAVVGEYGAQALLDYPSSAIKDPADKNPVKDLAALIEAGQPDVVYTHNLADKHDTHVAVALKLVAAIRSLPAAKRPKALYGCEVWRDLDWIVDADKVPFDLTEHENVQHALLGVFDSQIAGGKRYDLASMGRRKAHATYFASHGLDEAKGLGFGMNMTPLIVDDSLDAAAFLQGFIDRFQGEVVGRVRKFS